jgi:hypothetical protein
LFKHLAKSVALERYSAEHALQHPWITRELTDKIPLTYIDKLRQYNEALQL